MDVSSLGRRRCLAILDIVELSVSEMRPPPSASSEMISVVVAVLF
jgi:hypothetical protein